MGSRAAMILDEVEEVSRRTKENIPSSMLHRPVSCSLYYGAWIQSTKLQQMPVPAYEVHDNLAVRMRLELRRFLQPFSQCNVVVDLPIHGQNERLILVDQWLSASIYSIQPTTSDCRFCAPMPTIASRSWTSIVSFDMKHPDQSGPLCR